MGMTDIGKKNIQRRIAVAEGRILLKRETLDAVMSGEIKKGDPLKTAEIAAILAVKKTPELIPHCHTILIEEVNCDFSVDSESIIATVEVKTTAKTGVEMEALVGVTMALNTIWDMVKYLEKNEKGEYPETKITDIKIIRKVKI